MLNTPKANRLSELILKECPKCKGTSYDSLSLDTDVASKHIYVEATCVFCHERRSKSVKPGKFALAIAILTVESEP